MYRIGVDIGGMSVKTGVVDESGKILAVAKTKTDKNPDNAVTNIVSDIEKVIAKVNVKKEEILGIGIGCPGALDVPNGVIVFANNLNWHNVPLCKLLKDKFGLDAKLCNDADAAALAEALYGAGKDYKDSIMLTLGTGVGGGIVINGKLYQGGRMLGTELGHVSLVYDGLRCSCGRKGCIEMYASATALMRQTREAMEKDETSKMWDYCNGDINNVSGLTAFECEKLGDASARQVVDNYCSYLGESVMNFLNMVRPDAVILGGGISAQGKNLTDRIQAYCEKWHYGYVGAPRTEIVTAKLGNDAGIIGAASLFNL